MILERFPELAALSASEQLQLAVELARQAVDSSDTPELTPEAVALLEAQLDHLLDHPQSGVSWESLHNKKAG